MQMGLTQMKAVIFIAAAMMATGIWAQVKIPKKVKFEIKDQRIQFLPNGVVDVTTSPDGRLWLQLGVSRFHRFSLDEIKKQIAQEFHSKMPQLCGGLPVLFESNGRVWFIFNDRHVLLGYDGKEWIIKERDRKDGSGFWGRTRNSYADTKNFEFNKIPFIVDRNGIYWYKDKKLHYQEFIEDKKENIWKCEYFVSESAKRLLIYIRSRNVNLYYEFKDDKWEKVPIQKGMIPKLAKVVPIGKDNLFLGYERSLLQKHRDNPQKDVLDQLIAQLAADGYKERKKATTALKEFHADILPHLKASLGNCKDPEQKMRLKGVIETIEQRAAGSSMVVIGKYALKKPFLRFVNRLDESFVFTADEVHIGSKVHQRALFILKQDGSTTVVTDSATVNRVNNFNGDSPVFSATPEGFWFGEPSGSGGLRFFDLAQKKLTHRVPIDKFHIPRAVTKDGRLICNRYGHNDPVPLLMYSPDKPDAKAPLVKPVASISLPGNVRNAVVVDQDGQVWVDLGEKDGGIVRFDREAKKFMPQKALTGYRHLFSAVRHDSRQSDQAMKLFFSKNQKIIRGEDTLAAFIAKHDALLRKGHPASFHRIAFTKDATWLLQRGRLTCLRDGGWQDITDQLTSSKKGRKFYARVMAGTSTDGTLFVTNGSLRHDGGCSYLLSWEDDKLKAESVPHCTMDEQLRHRVYDTKGNYWYPASIGRALSTCDSITGQLAVCVKKDGSVEKFRNIGLPVFADRSDCIWLGDIRGNKTDKNYNILHNGKVVKGICLPSLPAISIQITSPAPGMVLVWNSYRLQQFAHPKDKTGEYSLQKEFFLSAKGKLTSMESTEDGYVVMNFRQRESSSVFVIHKDDLK